MPGNSETRRQMKKKCDTLTVLCLCVFLSSEETTTPYLCVLIPNATKNKAFLEMWPEMNHVVAVRWTTEGARKT